MNSASCDTRACVRCASNKCHLGTTWRWEEPHQWVREWVLIELAKPSEMKGWIGMCIGCHNVAIERCLVLGVFLSRLGMKVKKN
jgi:hypothetical protein